MLISNLNSKISCDSRYTPIFALKKMQRSQKKEKMFYFKIIQKIQNEANRETCTETSAISYFIPLYYIVIVQRFEHSLNKKALFKYTIIIIMTTETT